MWNVYDQAYVQRRKIVIDLIVRQTKYILLYSITIYLVNMWSSVLRWDALELKY